MLFKHSSRFIVLLVLIFLAGACGSPSLTTTVEVTGGTIEGVEKDGIFSYKGIPFAAPPVGDLRWKPPAPVQPWTGVTKADAFGLACMQAANSMGNSAPVSEDCLYLNVWTPARSDEDRLPVLVYFYGGGTLAGDGSEPRYDGESMARKGIVALTVNYRLNVIARL